MASLALAFDVLARDRASKTFKDVGDAAEKAGKKGHGFGTGIGKGMLIAGAGLAGLAAGAAAGLGAFVKDAAESAKIGRLTEAVVKSTGGAAKITAAQVGDLATAISNKTGADDEAIQSGANMLLTFTNVQNKVGKGNDIFNQATQTITDMSAALGSDTKASAIQLGKALNDPIKGVTALSKVGVSFTKQQKDQIKTLVESGDTMGAQKIILKELGKEFGGAAAAASDPMSRLKVIVGNLGEQVGGMLLPYIGKLADWVGQKVVPALSNFFTGMEKGTGAGGRLRDIIGTVVGKVQTFIAEFQNGTGAGGEFREKLMQVVDVAKDVAKWIGQNADLVKGLGAALLGGVGAFQAIVGVVRVFTAVQALLNVVMAANPIGIVIIAIAALAAGLIYAYKNSETFRKVVDTAFKAIAAAGRWLWNNVLAPVIRYLISGFETVTRWIGDMLDALSNIPGFGWAKAAADKLHGAADGARDLASNIRNIPDANVNVHVGLSGPGAKALQLAQQRKNPNVYFGAYASGGRNIPEGWALVGEEGPELAYLPGGSTVLPARQTAAIMAGGAAPATAAGSVAGAGRLHPHDIEALADAMSRRKATAVISRRSMERELVAGAP